MISKSSTYIFEGHRVDVLATLAGVPPAHRYAVFKNFLQILVYGQIFHLIHTFRVFKKYFTSQ